MATTSTNPAPYPREHLASKQPGWSRLLAGGVSGNARLTALAGILLLILLFAEGLTLLNIRALFTAHAFVGFLLVPPLGLKLASTGYRFIRYYTGSARYRAAGPPQPLPRMLAPFLVLATLALFGTGIAALLEGPGNGRVWRGLHTDVFFFWFLLMSAHVLTYALRAWDFARDDFSSLPYATVAGSLTRRSLLVGSTLLGVAIAVALVPWDSGWVSWLSQFHHGG